MADECVHCGICTKNCTFLQKYNLDIGDTERLKELAYHCFLCGKCTEVCPVGIDGRGKVLEIRRVVQEQNGYEMLLAEKKNYLFQNYKDSRKKSVLFPGCNFPSFYPRTTKELIRILKETADMGVIYDCCGKPVAELGLQEEQERIIIKINQRLKEAGAEEVVMVCPNCQSFLKEKLDVKVISIYEKLEELGLGKKIEKKTEMFLPCPERREKEMLMYIQTFLAEPAEIVKEIQCCGLGGCASVKEPELAREMAAAMRGREIRTYCASCVSNFVRNGCDKVSHVLVEILDTKEKPDTRKSLLNRIKTKFI